MNRSDKSMPGNGRKTVQSSGDKFRQMTEDPIAGLVIRLAIPSTISNLVTMVYNMADTYYIGRINTSASGAVGITLSAMTIINAVGFFFGQGSGNPISRLLGQKREDEAAQIAATAFFSSLFFSAVFCGLALLNLEKLCYTLGSTDTILPYAMDYMGIILAGGPFMATALVLNLQMRYQGLSFYSMIGLSFGGVLNIILDPIFIFRMDLGIAGAAWATILSQFISFWILFAGMQIKGTLKIRFRNLRPNLTNFKYIVNGGLPALSRNAINGFATAALNVAAKGYGDAAIAAMAIVGRVANFTTAAIIGFCQGFQPICGFNYGAGRYDRVRESYAFCLKVVSACLVVFCAAEYIFAPAIVEFFRKGDPMVVEIGAAALRYHCLTFWFSGFTMLNNMLLQTTAKVVKATILSLARQGLFLIPALKILPVFWGIFGVQVAQCFADVASLIIGIFFTLSMFRELRNGPDAVRAA